MTKISRWKVDKDKMDLFLDDFWSAVVSLETKQEARAFFNQFLTHTERKMFAKRFQVVMMLLLGYNYASIKNRVQVTDPTIAKMNNWIEESREALIGVAKRILSLKQQKGEKWEVPTRSGHVKGDLFSSLANETANFTMRTVARRRKKDSLFER